MFACLTAHSISIFAGCFWNAVCELFERWAISAESQNRLHRTAPTDDDTIWDTRCDDAGICNQYIWPLQLVQWKHGKNLAWEESFFLSAFWGFGAFSENLFYSRQRASIKGFHCNQSSDCAHAISPAALYHSQACIMLKTYEWVKRGKELPPTFTALGCKPCIPLQLIALCSQLSSAHLFLPSSYSKTTHCQKKLG